MNLKGKSRFKRETYFRSLAGALLLNLTCCLATGVCVEKEYLFRIKIPAVGTLHGPLIQRGFKLDGEPGILTTLHGVCDYGQTFDAISETGKLYRKLVLYKVDFENDAAILISPDLLRLGRAGFKQSGNTSIVSSLELLAFGLPEGVVWTKPVRIANTPLFPLSEVLPADLKTVMDQRQSPSPTITVLGLDGSLTPGYSGAPLIKQETGEIVGMVDGGLLGETAIAWGIPTSAFNWKKIDSDSALQTAVRRLATLPADHLFRKEERQTNERVLTLASIEAISCGTTRAFVEERTGPPYKTQTLTMIRKRRRETLTYCRYLKGPNDEAIFRTIYDSDGKVFVYLVETLPEALGKNFQIAYPDDYLGVTPFGEITYKSSNPVESSDSHYPLYIEKCGFGRVGQYLDYYLAGDPVYKEGTEEIERDKVVPYRMLVADPKEFENETESENWEKQLIDLVSFSWERWEQ